MKSVIIKASREYAVFIGDELIENAGRYISEIGLKGKKCAVVTDDTVNSLYGKLLCSSLKNSGFEPCFYILEHGEKSKNTANLIEILEFMAQNQLTRADFAVALGGGVVGDITGLAASLYLRGIEFVQIPTTILSSVDSSVGGKTAIDLKAGKNLAGTFYQPSLVLCDTNSFKTLPAETVADGYAEIIKYGAICDSDLLNSLDCGDISIEKIVARCVAIKRDIVQQDERDTGLRAVLNFGHTIGHAIEGASKYSITHGHAVAAGMAIISRACEKSGLCENGVSSYIEKILQKYNLPIKCEFDADTLSSYAVMDKKRSGGEITLIIPRKIGKCEEYRMKINELKEFISLGLEP